MKKIAHKVSVGVNSEKQMMNMLYISGVNLMDLMRLISIRVLLQRWVEEWLDAWFKWGGVSEFSTIG